MNLIGRVEAALDRGVNADVFERCAVALMANVYDKVEPIEGGSDGGRDADIYGPIADDPDSRGRILVTTGDMLDNLKSSHAMWEKTRASGVPFRVDQLVMVTHAPLSDAKRRNILKFCELNNLPVPQIWTRGWLLDALRKDPEWRVALTGVQGRLEAVRSRTAQTSDQPAMIGRADELSELQAAVELPGDTSLVGLPGVGKSRLVSELDGSIHQIEWRAREHLADDLVATAPSIVVLDDAHLHLDVLEELVRVRVREQLSFGIVAVLWPGAESDVEPLLEMPTRVQLDRQPRAEIDELIQQLGILGVRARQVILDQSDGRPGWASVLSELVVDGNGEGLTSGQYLLDQVAGLSRSISGTAALNDALACIAALGTASLEDLETVAAVTGAGYADLVSWLEATAQGGMVARTGDSWTVFPALQPLMVAAWFFGVRKTRRWESIVTRFAPDPRLDRTLLQIAGLVPGREALDLADKWFLAAEASGTNDEAVLGLVALYGQLTEGAADRAAALARRVLAAPREIETNAFGTRSDPIGDAATDVLVSAFRRTCSSESTKGLLDLTIEDDRPRHSHPDHPMRAVQELTQYLDPDMGPISELRERILGNALDWFDENPGETRWRVLAEAASYIFDPHVEGTWLDPGSHRSFTIARGIETADAVAKLVSLWDEIDSRVRGAVGSELSRPAASHLCEVFRVWSSLSTGSVDERQATSPQLETVAREGAARVLKTLAYLAHRFPAIPVRVNRQLDLIALWSNGASGFDALPILDDRIARFVGVREPDDDIEEWIAERRREEDALAMELAGLGARDGLNEFERLLLESEVLDGHYGGDGLATLLAEHVAEPAAWLRIAVDSGIRSVVGPMLTRARADQLVVDDLVEDALGDLNLRDLVLRVFFHETYELDSVAQSVLAALRKGDAAIAGDIWTVDTATPMLRALIVHPLAEVRAAAAVSFGEGTKHGPQLPDGLRQEWRAALVGADPEDLPHHSRWRLEKILAYAVTSDPELCAEWFIANAEMRSSSYRFRGPVKSFSEVIRALPSAQKRRICTQLPAATLIRSGFAGDLLGMGDGVAAELLAEGVVEVDLLLRSMSGRRDHTVEGLAPLLVAAGVDPEVIAGRALMTRETSGSVAESIRGDLTFFAGLSARRPELGRVCEVAASRLRTELDEAVSEERMEHLQGW